MNVKVEWIDRILSEVATKREHLNLLQKAKSLQKKIEQINREKEEVVRHLGNIDVENWFMGVIVFMLFIITESVL